MATFSGMRVAFRGLITSRNPGNLPALCAKLVEEVSEGRPAEEAAAARG